ncbi:MAG: alginate export family protein [Planctomycetes bacterium]|nr:alginate export family protein [Planctomycetota bacterium]
MAKGTRTALGCVAVVLMLGLAQAAGAEEPKPAEKAPGAPTVPALAAAPPEAAPAAAPAAPGAPQSPVSAEPTRKQPAGVLDRMDDWLDKTKTVAPWLTWGADLRLRNDYTNNSGLNKELAGHETNQQKYRPRWWMAVTPVKDIDLNVRIAWEGRHYSAPDGTADFDHSACLIDNLNLKLTRIGGAPLSMTVGRQDIILGDGWLVSDGTALDGARTVFFDAVRLALDIEDAQTLVDVIYVDQTYSSNRWWAPPLHSDHQPLNEQNERGLVLYLTNRSVKNTELNAYYMYKESAFVVRGGDDGHIHTFGGRMAGDLSDRWKYRAEGAHQFGLRNDRCLRAFGFNSALTYLFKDPWNAQVRGQYEFLSGDDPRTRTNEAFVPLWSRADRWSQILSSTWTLETRKYDITNLHRLGPGFACNPTDRLELSGDYYLLFADENSMTGARNRANFSESGGFRGQMIQTQVRYQFTRHLKGRILTEFFFPGNYYTDARNDVATFLRGELYFTW